MEAMLFIWFVGMLKPLSTLLTVLTVVTIVYVGLRTLDAAFSISDYDKTYRPEKYQKYSETLKMKWARKWIATAVVLSVLGVMLPTEKTAYMMAGAYVGQNVIQSDTAHKVKQMIDIKLDELLANVQGEVVKEPN